MKSSNRGVAAVEFSIMLPLLLLLAFTTGEIGRALFQYSHLTRMVRDAGRYLSTTAIPNTTESVPDPLDDGSCQNCISNTKDILVYGFIGGTVPLLRGLSTSNVNIAAIPSTDSVTITVDYDWQPLFGEGASHFGLGEQASTDLSFNMQVSYTIRAL
ncbi:pilus assembly protein [Shewanella psychropiezotolerans]|uniref:Pilus assembly protein n=1 Tax=Shewanella psychropiezotolerans TaxID=2593655 RepID=A0ABX5WYU4_9GAMM|nr:MULTISPECIES: TadE family protein [Shewanella]MPY24602.1 pilus assembly protein [Shewanella sp. YLB-07]QDO83971.1 pilus assembly protein [Shewanella psychropiezotolerans]